MSATESIRDSVTKRAPPGERVYKIVEEEPNWDTVPVSADRHSWAPAAAAAAAAMRWLPTHMHVAVCKLASSCSGVPLQSQAGRAFGWQLQCRSAGNLLPGLPCGPVQLHGYLC